MREGEPDQDGCRLYVVEFQSTPMREGEPASRGACCMTLLFQSTPMREGEPARSHVAASRTSFNPRPCVRANDTIVQRRAHAGVSIHAHA